MDNNIITFEKVSFSFNGEKVLDDVNFSIKKGDFVGIIGPNGSGKTTLLKIILKLLIAQEGKITLFNKPIQNFGDFKKIGYIPQKVTQLETKFPITVEEVISLGRISLLGLFGRMSRKDTQAVIGSLNIIEISDIKHKLITELSGGQQQRVFIAKALVSEPELLILDEPTIGVDTHSQEKFYQLLEKLNKEKKMTIILVSHDVGVIAEEVNTLFCLNRRLIYHGTPEKFFKSKYLEEIYGKGKKLFIHSH